MRFQISKILLLAAAALLTSVDANAARCGRAIVSLGDHQVDVRDACGEPLFADTHIVYPYELVNAPGVRSVHLIDIPIVIDEWVYDHGRQRFRQLFRFQNGRLVGVENLAKPR